MFADAAVVIGRRNTGLVGRRWVCARVLLFLPFAPACANVTELRHLSHQDV